MTIIHFLIYHYCIKLRKSTLPSLRQQPRINMIIHSSLHSLNAARLDQHPTMRSSRLLNTPLTDWHTYSSYTHHLYSKDTPTPKSYIDASRQSMRLQLHTLDTNLLTTNKQGISGHSFTDILMT